MTREELERRATEIINLVAYTDATFEARQVIALVVGACRQSVSGFMASQPEEVAYVMDLTVRHIEGSFLPTPTKESDDAVG